MRIKIFLNLKEDTFCLHSEFQLIKKLEFMKQINHISNNNFFFVAAEEKDDK